MRFRTHLVVSLLFALLTFPLFDLNKGVFLLIFLVASIVPDIDASGSLIGRHVPFIGWIFRHRGMFHSAGMAVALSIILYAFTGLAIASVFCLGYLTHLLADMLTPDGVALLFPLRWRVKGFIKTGSVAETMIFLVCMLIGFGLLLR
jgi:inner membrane protein